MFNVSNLLKTTIYSFTTISEIIHVFLLIQLLYKLFRKFNYQKIIHGSGDQNAFRFFGNSIAIRDSLDLVCTYLICDLARYFSVSDKLHEKMSIFRVFLVHIFPHSDWIRRDTPYLSVSSPNIGKYGPEKLRIRTLFTS